MQHLSEFKSIIELLKAFPDEQSCINHLENLRWDGVVISPFDETSKVYKCPKNRYKCRATNKYFNVRTGTIFEDSKIPLQKWFLALYLFSSHKKGISSHQLAKDISVTQKSAWFMLHRLRYAFTHPEFQKIVSESEGGGAIEIDESFIGGASKNKHANKKVKNERGGTMHTQQPVFGMRQRGGNVVVQVVENRNKETLLPIIHSTIEPNATVITDEYTAYKDLSLTYDHSRVNHGAKEYVNGMAHTNGIENFWSHMKRGIDGIYHWVSVKHLQPYVDEFSLRFNTRQLSTSHRFDLVLSNTTNKRLTYNTLINK